MVSLLSHTVCSNNRMHMNMKRQRRGKRRKFWMVQSLVILLAFQLREHECNGAFVFRSESSHHKRYPGLSSPHTSSRRPSYLPLYARKAKHTDPYRLGVYPYLNRPRKDAKNENETSDASTLSTNHTFSEQQQLQQEKNDLLLLRKPKSLASNIIDSFLDATNDEMAHHVAGPEELVESAVNATSDVVVNTTSSNMNNTSNIHIATTQQEQKQQQKPTARTTIKTKKKPTSILSPPQPFFSTWSYDMNKLVNNKYNRASFKKLKNKNNATSTSSKADSILANKSPTDVLTVADLEAILQDRGYVPQSQQLQQQQQDAPTKSKSTSFSKTTSSAAATTSTSKKGSSVAFPQQSLLSYKGLTIGSTAAAGLWGMVLGITIVPNLWLVGMLSGCLYGYEVSKNYSQNPPTNIVARGIIAMGRRLAKFYLTIYDWCYGIWFMYKTGQLSYDYYKQYAKLDERFGLQDKMDAWNARFVKGKQNFDAWEQNNEIGRRVIAGLRTAWLVEEKRRTQTRYRVVQYAQDAYQWCKRFIIAIWDAITGGGSSSLSEVLKGIRINISESRMQEIGPRIGAAIMALITITMVGSLYALAPRFLGLVAIATGVIWPTWVPELWDRLQLLASEFAATGRGEEVDDAVTTSRTGIPVSLSQQFGLYDRKRYSSYQREDGSRRWYRVGQPAFRSDNRVRSKKANKKSTNTASGSKKGSSGSGMKKNSSGTGSNKPWWSWST